MRSVFAFVVLASFAANAFMTKESHGKSQELRKAIDVIYNDSGVVCLASFIDSMRNGTCKNATIAKISEHRIRANVTTLVTDIAKVPEKLKNFLCCVLSEEVDCYWKEIKSVCSNNLQSIGRLLHVSFEKSFNFTCSKREEICEKQIAVKSSEDEVRLKRDTRQQQNKRSMLAMIRGIEAQLEEGFATVNFELIKMRQQIEARKMLMDNKLNEIMDIIESNHATGT